MGFLQPPQINWSQDDISFLQGASSFEWVWEPGEFNGPLPDMEPDLREEAVPGDFLFWSRNLDNMISDKKRMTIQGLVDLVSGAIVIPSGLPDGGTTGQALIKASNDDQDVEWWDLPAGFSWMYWDLTGVPSTFAPSTHSHPISDITSLQDALDSKIDGTLTATRIPFASDSNTLTDEQYMDWTTGIKALTVYGGVTEKVLNGSFTGNANNWTVGSGWAYSANSVSKTSNGTATLTQSGVAAANQIIEVTYTISNWTVGTVTATLGGVSMTARSANGTYTERIYTTNNSALSFTPSNTARFTIDNVSAKLLTGGHIRLAGTSYVWESIISQSASNYTPGTTRHQTFANPTGSYTHIDYRFWNSLVAAMTVDSSGTFYFTGTNWTTYWRYGTTSPTQFSYTYSAWLVHTGTWAFGSGIHAGSQSVTKSSKLTVAGGTWFGTQLVMTNTTLDDSATEIYARPDLSSACTGTASTACSSHASQGACEANESHGWCSWVGIDCSSYNYTDEATCESYGGCTYDEANCSDSGWYDQSSCEAADDSYGGSCTYNVNYGDCSFFNPTDQWTCEWTSGCSWYDNSCSSYFGDEGSCLWNGCYYNSWTGDCVGVCSGSYESWVSCDGTYFTGNCSGSGGSCTGTPSCGSINSSTPCGAEAWCTWSTGLTITMPSHGGSTTFYRTYWIHNGSAATALTVMPNTDQTINGTTSLSIPAWDSKKLTFFYFSINCGTWSDTSSGTCTTGHTGCSWTDCSTYDEMNCTGVCSWVEWVCTWNGICEGTWILTRNWAITADFT